MQKEREKRGGGGWAGARLQRGAADADVITPGGGDAAAAGAAGIQVGLVVDLDVPHCGTRGMT